MQFLPNMIGVVFAPIICGEMHFLLISENLFFHDIKRDGITSLHGIHVVFILSSVLLPAECIMWILAK